MLTSGSQSFPATDPGARTFLLTVSKQVSGHSSTDRLKHHNFKIFKISIEDFSKALYASRKTVMVILFIFLKLFNSIRNM